jgi:tetratricopeptide (TPR) repeat protein
LEREKFIPSARDLIRKRSRGTSRRTHIQAATQSKNSGTLKCHTKSTSQSGAFFCLLPENGLAISTNGKANSPLSDRQLRATANGHGIHTLLNRAQAHLDKGDSKQAVQILSAALVPNSSNAALWTALGVALRFQTRLEEAASAFEGHCSWSRSGPMRRSIWA